MAAPRDIEDVLAKIGTFFKANLNTKLAALDTEKADGVTLKQVDATNGYFEQTMAGKEAVYDPYCYYGVANIEADGIAGATAKLYSLHVMIIVADPGTDPNITKRMWRYLRALEELVESNYDRIERTLQFKVNSLVPVPIVDRNGDEFRACGIELQFHMA